MCNYSFVNHPMDICLRRATGPATPSFAGTSGRAQHGAPSRRGPAAPSPNQTALLPALVAHHSLTNRPRVHGCTSRRKSPNRPGLVLRADPLVSITLWICSYTCKFSHLVTRVHCGILLACGMYSHLSSSSIYVQAIYSSEELIRQGFFSQHFFERSVPCHICSL